MKIDFNKTFEYGKLSKFQVDNSAMYIICIFENYKIALFSLEDSQLVRTIATPPGVSLESVEIDDLTSFMGCLDPSRRFIHLLVF